MSTATTTTFYNSYNPFPRFQLEQRLYDSQSIIFPIRVILKHNQNIQQINFPAMRK